MYTYAVEKYLINDHTHWHICECDAWTYFVGLDHLLSTKILYIILFSRKKPCYDILIKGFSKVSNYFQNEKLENDKK